MKRNIAALASGALFGIGLGIGGMTQPQKIIGFLDVTGAWDPSLNFVMLGAVAVFFAAFQLHKRWSRPLLADIFQVPTRRDIDRRLVIGSVIFGVGWGLGGYCPGPAFVSLVGSVGSAAVFLVAMFVGMQLLSAFDSVRSARRSAAGMALDTAGATARTQKAA